MPSRSPIIEVIPLVDGGVTLTSQERSKQNRRKDGSLREQARIITFAWGERYLSDLMDVSIPAVMSPGNIPAFSENFESTLVIVTERRFFDSISRYSIIQSALITCDVRLIPIDDLLSPWYGITLTYALMRGFADLGAAMKDTHLVFFNADFVVADGSYRTLAQRIIGGARLAVAPSYCMELEQALPKLRARRTDEGTLTVPPRDMAAVILEHRHNTIRAKTMNRPFLRTQRYDQFYWHVNDNTLLARQMPISVVYMRPERVITEMPTFWDYGVVSELCPTAKPCVLSDSDDFLMGELRTANSSRELLQPGTPDINEIARDLTTFTTQDHRDYGRHTLILHSAELPINLAEESRHLAHYVDGVYERLGPPLDYRNHPFWVGPISRFLALQQDQSRQHKASVRGSVSTTETNIARPPLSIRAQLLDRSMQLYRRLFGTLPRTTQWHPLHASLKHVLSAIDKDNSHDNTLFISSGGLLTAPLGRCFVGRQMVVTPEMIVNDVYGAELTGRGKFDFCFCDLSRNDLMDAQRLIDTIQPLLKPKSKIVLFHFGQTGTDLDRYAQQLAQGLFTFSEISDIHYTGSIPATVAAKTFMNAAKRFDFGFFGKIKMALALAATAPVARLASFLEEQRGSKNYRPHCTSLTIEIESR